MALVKCNHCGKESRNNHPLFLARCIWCNKEFEDELTGEEAEEDDEEGEEVAETVVVNGKTYTLSEEEGESEGDVNRGMLNDLNKWMKRKVYRFFSLCHKYAQPLVNTRQVEILRKYMYTGNISTSEAVDLRKFIARSAAGMALPPAIIVSPILGWLGAGLIGAFIFIWWKIHGIEWLAPNPDSNDYIDKAAAKEYRDYDNKDSIAKLMSKVDKHYTETREDAIEWLNKNIPLGKFGKKVNNKK